MKISIDALNARSGGAKKHLEGINKDPPFLTNLE